MASQGIIGSIDQVIGDFFSQWNLGSSVIAGLVAIVLIYPLLTSKDPDTHPFLLARQAQASPIRQPGESATYRSIEIPYGYPLRSGLAVKDPGASKWTTGRDGDLRDVWRQAVNGPLKEDGTPSGAKAKISTILGTDKVIEHDLRGLTLDINVIGKYLKNAGSRKVAVCLSNSVEILCTVFAGSYYGFSPILMPYSQVPEATRKLLGTADFDTLIAEAGSVAVDQLLSKNTSIKRVIWVTKPGSKHLDWNEVPEGVGGKVDVSTWQDLVEEYKAGTPNEVPELDREIDAPSVFAYWPQKTGDGYDLIEYTQKNLVAGIAAIQSSLPRLHKLSSSDVVLPTTPITSSYSLCWALLTLFSGATLVMNSVAGPTVNVLAATKSAREKVKPTHVIADARAVAKFANDVTALAGNGGMGAKYSTWSTGRAIAQGYMPDSTIRPPYLPAALSALKAFYIVQPDYVGTNERVSSSTIATLRLLLSSRVALALTTGRVAGFVTQTNILDYRDKGGDVCVGPVSASIELHLAGEEDAMKRTDGTGTVTVKGPAVTSKGKDKIVLETVRARVDGDNTLILV